MQAIHVVYKSAEDTGKLQSSAESCHVLAAFLAASPATPEQ